MLKDYPVKFNGSPICTPSSWSEKYDVVETINKTEAGTEQISVTRYDKLTVSVSFQCSSGWAARLKAYSREDRLEVSIFNVETEDYEVRSMRIRDYKAALENNSHRLGSTNGLWKISFSLEEF